MIIDDQTGVTKVVGFIAAQLGLDFRAVNDPLNAAEDFIAYEPDVLILDVVMPGKDGIDVLNEILLTGIPTKVVLTSGYGDAYLQLAEGVSKLLNAEHIAFLRKPFRRMELVMLLTDLIGTTERKAAY